MKLLMLELDYELSAEEMKNVKNGTAPLTRNLINQAYQTNNPQMDAKTSRQWRSVRRVLNEVIDDKKMGFALFASSDFDSVYDEVYKARYSGGQAQIAPYLLDELDIVKNRSNEEEEKIQKEMIGLKEAVSESKKEPLSDGEKSVVDEKLKEIVAASK